MNQKNLIHIISGEWQRMVNEYIFSYPLELLRFFFFSNRNYALRRIRDTFKENKSLSQVEEVNKQFKFAKENLDVIKRQVISALNLNWCLVNEKCLIWNVFVLILGDSWKNVFIGSISH